MSPSTRTRLIVVAVAHAVATGALAAYFSALGPTAGVFGFLPVIAGALAFGFRGGVVSTALQWALNTVVMRWIVDPPQEFNGSSLLAIALFFAVGAAVGNQRDLSRRLHAELVRNERLRVRERETLAALPDVMIHVHRDGACRLRGVAVSGNLEAVVERGFGQPLDADSMQQVTAAVGSVREAGREQSLTLELPGMAVHDLRFLPAADGAVLIVIRDVTDERRLLRRVTAAENLAALGTLAAGLAHEINNPLTYVITGISEVQRSRAAGEPIAAAELDAILEGCWRIRDIVRHILETKRSNSDSLEAVCVPDAIEAALALVRAQISRRATVQWDPGPTPAARAHRTKLVEVLVNLMVNAAQSFADVRASANVIRVSAHGEGDAVVIQVQDNGLGMDEATCRRAREPFFTTKDPGQGTGLGLFLSAGIVESLGGTLQLESELGVGTKVTVRLPASAEAPQSGVVRRSLGAAPVDNSARTRALVVDDEPEIRRALRRILGREHEVSASANGADALARLVAGERFDVILCDLLMPEMTGIDLFRELQRSYPEQAARVVFITGGATSESARAFLDEHAGRTVNKPFHPSEIESAVRAVLATSIPPARPSVAPA